MQNKILHALSNRQGPFASEIFSRLTDFVPVHLNSEAVNLRRKLFLDVTDTDYYLKIYLSLLYSFPDISRQLSDRITTYCIEDFNPRGVEISGGELCSAPNIAAFFTDTPPTSLPVNLTYEVNYITTTYAQLKALESGLVQKIYHNATGTDPRKLLRFDWPENFPFSGPIRLSQPWQENACVRITVAPSKFPFQLLWNSIASDRYLNRLLLNAGLIDEFIGTVDVQEKIALALAVLALDNQSVFPV
jgi:hypothetical protein